MARRKIKKKKRGQSEKQWEKREQVKRLIVFLESNRACFVNRKSILKGVDFVTLGLATKRAYRSQLFHDDR